MKHLTILNVHRLQLFAKFLISPTLGRPSAARDCVCVVQYFSSRRGLNWNSFLSFKSTLNRFKNIAFLFSNSHSTGISSIARFLSFACQLISPCEKRIFADPQCEKKKCRRKKKKKSIQQNSPLTLVAVCVSAGDLFASKNKIIN